MSRIPGTDAKGGQFDQATVQAVWNKGREIPNFDRHVWRYDRCGGVMKRSDHGANNTQYGWEIDHERPLAKGGTDDLSNLQPLQWENNRAKGDSFPWKCP
jgi:hypothetical protein